MSNKKPLDVKFKMCPSFRPKNFLSSQFLLIDYIDGVIDNIVLWVNGVLKLWQGMLLKAGDFLCVICLVVKKYCKS
ncbi:MAG: hypothetical protein LBT09_02470 [Planctomycetaceae bacterium]|nr:hypothetical protein [Planctomycetaceae bacterium]